jgi:hypothetical protein
MGLLAQARRRQKATFKPHNMKMRLILGAVFTLPLHRIGACILGIALD